MIMSTADNHENFISVVDLKTSASGGTSGDPFVQAVTKACATEARTTPQHIKNLKVNPIAADSVTVHQHNNNQ